MCEIQLINRFNGDINDEDKAEFVRMMNEGAERNNDAFGFFNHLNTYKIGKGFNKKTKSRKVVRFLSEVKGNFLVGHNRLATKGDKKKNENNHPIETRNWMVVHNGVLYNDDELKEQYKLKYREEVDSAIIPRLLEYFTEKGETENDCVKKVAEEISGWYSVICYHKESGMLYYFKNDKTDFYMALVEDKKGKVLIGSTNEETIENCYTMYDMIFVKPKYYSRVITEVEDQIIYRITKKSIKPLVDFKENTTSTYGGYAKRFEPQYVIDEHWDYGKTLKDWIQQYPYAEVEIDQVRERLVELSGEVNTSSRIDYQDGMIFVKVRNKQATDEILEEFYEAEQDGDWISLDFESFLTPEVNME